MSEAERRLPLERGEPRKLRPPAARSTAPVDLSQVAEVTVVLRAPEKTAEWRKLLGTLTSGPPSARRYLTREEFARDWSVSDADVDAVRKFASAHGLKVVHADAFRRCVVVSAPLRELGRAFAVDFDAIDHPAGTFRTTRGAPHVPASIHPLVSCILGLDNVPVARPHSAEPKEWHGMHRKAILDAYAIPTQLTGKGQCVAIVELGGGFAQDDLTAYFAQFDLPPPHVEVRSIGGVKNDPAPPDMMRRFMDAGTPEKAAADPTINLLQVQWTIETMTDLSMVGTIAPEVSILLLQATDDDQGQYHAITTAIADSKNEPSLMSCSWGGPELSQTPALMTVLDQWFQVAAALGMTVCCSSGDSGPAPVTHDGVERFTAQFPATSPYVLACGGTTLHPALNSEVAWNQSMNGVDMASGGGFSEFFPLPSWQDDAGIDAEKWIPRNVRSGTGRAIPDVAARANMEQGYCTIVGGVGVPCGGTSSAAPLWAGVVALLNEGLNRRMGSLHELLYKGSLAAGIRDIVDGKTCTAFCACKGWDPCTGWGSPRAKELLRVLGDAK